MSRVHASERKESKFEVIAHFYKLRKEITNLTLHNFSYDYNKSLNRLIRVFHCETWDDVTNLSPQEQARIKGYVEKHQGLENWYLEDERYAIIHVLREIGSHITSANNIFPYYKEELIERRLYQDRAIAACNNLLQELQYVIDIIPVNVNAYTGIATMIEHEIKLLKGWRTSDNRVYKHLIDG